MTTLYRYSFDKRLVVFWGVFGVRPAKDGVSLTDDGRLRATFGLLKLETPLGNVDGAHITRNYRRRRGRDNVPSDRSASTD